MGNIQMFQNEQSAIINAEAKKAAAEKKAAAQTKKTEKKPVQPKKANVKK